MSVSKLASPITPNDAIKKINEIIDNLGGGGGGGSGDYIIAYEESNAIGTAIVGTAKTGEPNYIPSGDIAYTDEEVLCSGELDFNYNSNNATLSIYGLKNIATNKPVVTSIDQFIGSGVTFIIVQQ